MFSKPSLQGKKSSVTVQLMTDILQLFAVFVLSYLLGSVPFGVVLSNLFNLGDLRSIGSGNIGATNVLRTGNKKAAAGTLICDMGKGAVAVLLARHFVGETAALIAGLGAFLGHLYPIWLNFKGGKGVATFLGVVLAINFIAGLIACAVWLITAYMGRISSLSALTASLIAPLWLGLLQGPQAALLGLVLAVLIWVKHRPNIERLLDGSESLIGKN